MKNVPIGAVGFARWVRPKNAQGYYEWLAIMGDERQALLQKVLDDEPLPPGILLVAQRPGGGFEMIEKGDVNWETSSLRPRR
jgi:hypothetical protein